MRLARWYPWGELYAFQRDLSRLFRDFFGETAEQEAGEEAAWAPLLDVSETPEAFLVRVEIPGVDKDKVELSVEQGVFTIRGERPAEPRAEGETCIRAERPAGRFVRTLALPESADPDKVTAGYRDGVLEVKIAKREAAKPRKIAISE